MATLVWDETGQRFYETGVSKCVFYDNEGHGIAWNGLTSVDENAGDTVQPVHFDGLKFNDILTVGDFSAIMRAWTYPAEFLPYEGILEDQKGFYVTQQQRHRFGLCYRTEIGNDIEGVSFGYKIHILYNLTAVPSQISNHTMALDTEPLEFEWNLSAIPEFIENYRPTAHIIFDSRYVDPWMLEDLEGIIYGDADSDAYLPPLKGLATFIEKWDRFVVTDHGDGTWTASSPREGQIVMLDATMFQITADTAVVVNPTTYTLSSSDKNDEDIPPPGP